MGLPEIVTALAAVERRCAGVKHAFDLPPDGEPTPLPCFLNMVDDGDLVTPRMPGTRQTYHRIQAIALVAYEGRLGDAERVSRALIPEFIDELDDDKTLGGLAGISEAAVTRYRKDQVTLGTGDGARSYVGVIFDVQVHEIETGVTYS